MDFRYQVTSTGHGSPDNHDSTSNVAKLARSIKALTTACPTVSFAPSVPDSLHLCNGPGSQGRTVKVEIEVMRQKVVISQPQHCPVDRQHFLTENFLSHDHKYTQIFTSTKGSIASNNHTKYQLITASTRNALRTNN